MHIDGFLSYARVDGASARELHDTIEAADQTLHIWWDQENQLGHDWTEQLMLALRSANTVLVVVTRSSVGSDGVKREVVLAEKLRREVLAVLYDPEDVLIAQERCGLMYFLSTVQWLSACNHENPVPEIVRHLQRKRQTSQHPDSPAPQTQPLATLAGAAHTRRPPRRAKRARLEVVLNGSLANFGAEQRTAFAQLLAALADIAPDEIAIVDARNGSVILTLELPEQAALWLVDLQGRQDRLLKALDIQRVGGIRPVPYVAPFSHLEPYTVPVPQSPSYGAPLARLEPPVAPVPQSAPYAAPIPQQAARGRGRNRLLLAGAAGALLAVMLLFCGASGLFLMWAVRGAALVEAPTPRLEPSGEVALAEPGALSLCGDLSLRAGRCPQGAQSAFFEGPSASATRLSPDGSQPARLIVPRGGALLSVRPTVRWTPVAGTQSYTVTLTASGDGLLWTSVVRGKTELAYPPPGAPPLERGRSYSFEVRADNAAQENARGASFVVATAAEAQKAQDAAQEVRRRRLDPSAEAALIANGYARAGYYADALALLAPGADKAQPPAVDLLLGNLYVAVGLPDLAAAPFERAAERAEQAGDPLTRALALTRLGEVLSTRDDRASQARARANYRQAIAIYERLGYDQRVRKVEELAAKLP